MKKINMSIVDADKLSKWLVIRKLPPPIYAAIVAIFLINDTFLIKKYKNTCIIEKKVVILQPDLLCGGVYICVHIT